MASASFSRDEVILALDVLYTSEKQRVTADSQAMRELSALLNRLPIHPVEDRRSIFRNATGVTRQINLFRTSCNTGKINPNIGSLFFDIAFEFEDRRDELHNIAAAIRRNETYYDASFGAGAEDVGFPEGILLGHLHRLIEVRDGARVIPNDHCSICELKPDLYYQPCGKLLEQHLLVSPIAMDGKTRYPNTSFITVCPNCHAALHRFRPWRTREDLSGVLR